MSTVNMGAVAPLAGLFLAGAMMNIAILDVPVLLEANMRSSAVLVHWAKLYEHGARLYPFLSVTVGFLYLCGIVQGGNSKGSRILLFTAAATTLSMIPWTLIQMTPTNNTLMQARDAVDRSMEMPWEEAESLIVHWQRLHFWRSLFPLVGSIIGILDVF
ncbi:hypothetical protein F5Y18DRAFT_424164 [Xylariaceae sp. FL1019]|nr:hypothetical protein F5Y18DRAFT_424164 [Xylariaceae sp. FL1019]